MPPRCSQRRRGDGPDRHSFYLSPYCNGNTADPKRTRFMVMIYRESTEPALAVENAFWFLTNCAQGALSCRQRRIRLLREPILAQEVSPLVCLVYFVLVCLAVFPGGFCRFLAVCEIPWSCRSPCEFFVVCGTETIAFARKFGICGSARTPVCPDALPVSALQRRFLAASRSFRSSSGRARLPIMQLQDGRLALSWSSHRYCGRPKSQRASCRGPGVHPQIHLSGDPAREPGIVGVPRNVVWGVGTWPGA